jgi:hypothetical protein
MEETYQEYSIFSQKNRYDGSHDVTVPEQLDAVLQQCKIKIFRAQVVSHTDVLL